MPSLDIAAEHAALLGQLSGASRPYRGGVQNDSYSGSGRPFLNVGAPERRSMIRAWLAAHRGASDDELIALTDSLFDGKTHEEKTLGALLLGYSRRARGAARPAMMDGWLGQLNGWAEIDSLCASVFSAQEMAGDWPAWRASARAARARSAGATARRRARRLARSSLRAASGEELGSVTRRCRCGPLLSNQSKRWDELRQVRLPARRRTCTVLHTSPKSRGCFN